MTSAHTPKPPATWLFLFGPRSECTEEVGRMCARKLGLTHAPRLGIDKYVANEPAYIVAMKKTDVANQTTLVGKMEAEFVKARDSGCSQQTGCARSLDNALAAQSRQELDTIFVQHTADMPAHASNSNTHITRVACFALSEPLAAYNKWVDVVRLRMKKFIAEPGLCGDPPPVLGADGPKNSDATAMQVLVYNMYNHCMDDDISAELVCARAVYSRLLVYDCNGAPTLVFDSAGGRRDMAAWEHLADVVAAALGVTSKLWPRQTKT